MKERIQDGINGWLFDDGNVEILNNKLSTLIQRPERILEVANNIEKRVITDEAAAIVEEILLQI